MRTEHRSFLLLREYLDTRNSNSITVRITHPIYEGVHGQTETWVCYLHISGMDGGYCFPCTQVDQIGAILGAVETAQRILEPIEEFLQFADADGPVGTSEFPRMLPLLLSKRALERIDAIIEEEPRRSLKWPSIDK